MALLRGPTIGFKRNLPRTAPRVGAPLLLNMPTYSATGITLLVHKYKGTERLAAFYTRERGKVEATVRGVGKPASKLAPAVEPLTLSKLFFAEGRTFDLLIQCEVLDTFYDIRKDLNRLALASYVAELVAQTTEPGEPDPLVFDALAQTLGAMAVTNEPELVTWGFVLKYLGRQGVGPIFESCVGCGEELQRGAHYAPSLGGCVCGNCSRAESGGLQVSAQTRAAMRTLTRMDPDRLDRLRLVPATQMQIREVLRRHVRYHMGVELKSESFMQKMANVGAQRKPRRPQGPERADEDQTEP